MSAEQEPSFNINLGETKFNMTRRNTYLYTFMGKAALYNHVFLERDDLPPTEDGQMLGTYLFEDLLPNKAVWEQLKNTLQHNEYPQYLNHAEPSEMDINSYMRIAMLDLDKTPDWLPEE